LQIPRSSFYYKYKGLDKIDLEVMNWIDEIYTDRPFYGSRRIRIELKRKHAIIVNRKYVRRLMQIMGIAGICPKRNLSKANLADKKYPYLLKDLKIVNPNQVWGIDITYIRLKTGWIYLVAIIDWFSRYVVAWEVSTTLEISFCLDTLKSALTKAKPMIVNSDQGSHFTSEQFTSLVLVSGSEMSMDSKGRALDNIFTERFWRSLKYEDIYLKEYETVTLAKAGIAEYINFYNTDRPHQSLKYKTPAEIYFNLT
jgi:putative transposase